METKITVENKYPLAVYDVEINSGEIKENHKELDFNKALEIVEKIINDNPNNEFIQEAGKSCLRSFGFTSITNGDEKFNISAYRKPNGNISDDEKFYCPRNILKEKSTFGQDYWQIRGDDRCCSYCGGLHPDDVLKIVESQGFSIIDDTDKYWKKYLTRKDIPNAGFGGIKFYTYHFSEEQIDKYNNLLTAWKKNKSSENNK